MLLAVVMLMSRCPLRIFETVASLTESAAARSFCLSPAPLIVSLSRFEVLSAMDIKIAPNFHHSKKKFPRAQDVTLPFAVQWLPRGAMSPPS